MTDAIKHAVWRKHMSLLAIGMRSDHFDEKPPYWEFMPAPLPFAINQIWSRYG